jgi:hypothetical protein
VCTGRGGRSVSPARGRLVILLLNQHLRPDAVDAIKQWIERAQI